MTLLPDRIGDTGIYRYEIRCLDADGEIHVIGWSDDPKAFRKGVDLHPSHHSHHAVERQATHRSRGEQ